MAVDDGAVGLDHFPQAARRILVVPRCRVRPFLGLEVAIEGVAVAREPLLGVLVSAHRLAAGRHHARTVAVDVVALARGGLAVLDELGQAPAGMK